MSSTYARRRVATRLSRSVNRKNSKDGVQDDHASQSRSGSRSRSHSKGSSISSIADHEADDIPVPSIMGSGSSSDPSSNSQNCLEDDNKNTINFPLQLKRVPSDRSHQYDDPLYSSVYTPSKSTFGSSVSSKRKASVEVDPHHLRRSVRQRPSESSPFRYDSTEEQRDAVLFNSEPQTPSKLKHMSPTNRKDSLFMSLPASFSDTNEAQYAPIFDVSLLSANSNISCFLPTGNLNSPSKTPAEEPLSAPNDFSNYADFLQFNDFIAPFPPTPQPAFLNFPPTTPKYSGSFAIAPSAISGNAYAAKNTSTDENAATPVAKTPRSPGKNSSRFVHPREVFASSTTGQAPLSEGPKTPLNPIRALPRRARKPSTCSSNTGSIIVKDLTDDEEEEEAEEADEEQDDDDDSGDEYVEEGNSKEDVEDERFALFASQVRRKAEALSLRSSLGQSKNSPSKQRSSQRRSGGTGAHGNDALLDDLLDSFPLPNNVAHGQAPPATPLRGKQGPRQENASASTYTLPPMPAPLPGQTHYQQVPYHVQSDLEDMGVSPAKDKAKRGHHNKKRGDKPPRPPNCFMLYRSDKVEEIKAKHANQKEKMQKDISKLVAELWKAEPPAVRNEYSRRADQAREEHLLKYPGYVYQPTRKDRPADQQDYCSSPMKRSNSEVPPQTPSHSLARSMPASRTTNYSSRAAQQYYMPTEDVQITSSPSLNRSTRAKTPIKQSFIPVPSSSQRQYSTPRKESIHARPSGIPVSAQKLAFSNKRTSAIEKNAEAFANQRGLHVSSKGGLMVPETSAMQKTRSTPSNMVYNASSPRMTSSAPRYAQPTSASMSKSNSQPLPATPTRTAAGHPQEQYSAYAHLHHPSPLSPRETQNMQNALFEQMMASASSPHRQQVQQFSTPSSAGRSNLSRQGSQRGLGISGLESSSVSKSRRSQVPSLQRSNTSPPQLVGHEHQAAEVASPALPDGFVVNGRLYPYANVAEAMAAAFEAGAQSGQRPVVRVFSNRSTGSNGPAQELVMPQLVQTNGQSMQYQMQTQAQPSQMPLLAIGPDGQQYMLVATPQQPTTAATPYTPWQNSPAFMPPSSSAHATPSSGFVQDFNNHQLAEPLQYFDYNSLYTPNTGDSNLSNMLSNTTFWYPQQDTNTQTSTDTQQFAYTQVPDDSMQGTSPAFYFSDANGQQQNFMQQAPSLVDQPK